MHILVVAVVSLSPFYFQTVVFYFSLLLLHRFNVVTSYFFFCFLKLTHVAFVKAQR